jgi:hypothetical protein
MIWGAITPRCRWYGPHGADTVGQTDCPLRAACCHPGLASGTPPLATRRFGPDQRGARRLDCATHNEVGTAKTDALRHIHWLNRSIWQFPIDAWILQEVVSALRPNLSSKPNPSGRLGILIRHPTGPLGHARRGHQHRHSCRTNDPPGAGLWGLSSGNAVLPSLNIQWAGVLVSTLFWCRFRYSDQGGVMDREHVRGFTRRTLHSDLHTHGWAPVRWAGPMYPKFKKVDRVTLRRFSDARRHPLHVKAVAT